MKKITFSESHSKFVKWVMEKPYRLIILTVAIALLQSIIRECRRG